jgi:hypothetical protein
VGCRRGYRLAAGLTQALALARRLGKHQMVAFALRGLGEAAFAAGDDVEAGRLWEESLNG